MRINTLYIAFGLVNYIAASPFNATPSTTIGCWRPLESQKVLDLEVVYGEDVIYSFKSWNPRVINVDHIFPNVTYNVSYYDPLAAAAIAASISWSPSFADPSTTTMFLKVPRYAGLVHETSQATAISPGAISSSIGTSTQASTPSSVPSTTSSTTFNSGSDQSPSSAPSSTQKHTSSGPSTSSISMTTSALTSTLGSVSASAPTSIATSMTTSTTTSTTISTTTSTTASQTASQTASKTTSTATPKTTSSSTSAPSLPVLYKNECHGVIGPYWVISRNVAVDNAKTFCKQEEKVVTYNIDSVNQLELSVSKTGDETKSPRDDPSCLNRIRDYIIDGCDGNDSKQNPLNYKFGSKLTSSDGWVYEMKPLNKKVNEVSCDVSHKLGLYEVEIRGKNVPYAKLGVGGVGLKKQINGCGLVSYWDFKDTPDDAKFQWYFMAQVPALVWIKECVGNALMTAGGAGRGHCHR